MRLDGSGMVCLLIAGLAAAGCGTTGGQPPSPATAAVPAASEVAAPASPGVRLKCETYCSQERRGTVNARITWRSSGAAGGAEAAPAPGQERLETTVFNGGFERGLYASFPLLGPGEEMQEVAEAQRAVPDLPAFDLRIVSVERGARPEAAPGAPGQPAAPEPANEVVVEGLEPGLSYSWRLAVPSGPGSPVSETVTCMAPVCPVDRAEED
ncbi:MAG TPA: hypothetical protein VEW48_04485 [Thermoanaerobaculia bacterium]|nr:hypothetical protein [Thermoanaerobaculia bacterium]